MNKRIRWPVSIPPFEIEFPPPSPAFQEFLRVRRIREKEANKRIAEKRKLRKEIAKRTPRRGLLHTFVNGKWIPNDEYDKRKKTSV